MDEESTKYLDFIFVRMEAEIREKIAKEIEALHPDKSWTYDADMAKVIEEVAAIARGKDNG
jgi:hypothetical protein